MSENLEITEMHVSVAKITESLDFSQRLGIAQLRVNVMVGLMGVALLAMAIPLGMNTLFSSSGLTPPLLPNTWVGTGWLLLGISILCGGIFVGLAPGWVRRLRGGTLMNILYPCSVLFLIAGALCLAAPAICAVFWAETAP